MTRFALIAIGCLALVAWTAQDAHAVPVTSSFTARISDNDGPITADVSLNFRIYDAQTNGTLVWEETHPSISPDNGLVFAELGAIDPGSNGLDETVFTGAAMFLEVSVDGAAQSPRVPILSVPYAIRAAVADNVENENDPVFGASVAAGITAGNISDWNSDTVLTEAQVDAYVANNNYALTSHNHTGVYATTTHNHTNYATTTHNHAGVYATSGHNHSTAYAALAHNHSAANITSGTLNTGRYSAYTDLSAEGYLSNNGGGDLLTRTQADGRFAADSHGHPEPQSGRTNLTGSTAGRTATSFTVAKTGTCIAWVHTYSYAANNTSGYYYIRPYRVINGVAATFGSATIGVEGQNSPGFHSADDMGSWPVNAGDTAAFGCYVQVSGTDWMVGEVTCNVAWLCN